MPLSNNNNQSLWVQPYKLISPSINQKLIKRTRLFELLCQSQYLPITCLVSPAGFGKSTLVVSWLQHESHSFGWYSLDINDNDASVFANHLIYALHEASGGACPQSLALVQQQEYADLHGLISKAMMEIAQVSHPFYLVLDDLQELTNPEIISVVRHWLKLVPAQLHIILCCQNEPPVPLTNFRVRGQLLEIGALQLAFDADETKKFLANNHGFDLNPQTHLTLFERTGGWPAALQLVSLNKQSEEELLYAAQRLGQSANDVEEYVLNEVFDQQPDKLKQFLFDICIFEKFNAALCNELIGHTKSEELISEIEHRQLFLTRVEGEVRWYQLQDIFRGVLLTRLNQSDAQRLQQNRVKAVEAYLKTGMAIEAIQLSLQLADETLILCVLKQVGFGLYKNGQFNTLAKLFSSVGEINLASEPNLALLKSWLLLATYREEEVKFLLPDQHLQAEAHPSTSELWAEQAVAQAQASVNAEDFDRAHALAEQAITFLKPESYVSRTVAYSVLGQSALCRGELDKAQNRLEEAGKLAFDHRLFQQRLWSMCLISDVLTAKGELTQALQTQKNTIDMAHDACVDNLLHMEFLYRNRSRLFIEQGDLNQSERLLLMSEKIMEPLGGYGLLNVHILRGFIALWRGQTSTARGLAFQVNYLMQQHSYHTDWQAHGYEFLLACEQSKILDFKPTYRWQQKLLSLPACNHFYQHYQRVHAISLYLSGEEQEAKNKITTLVEVAKKHGLTFQRFKAKLLLALWQNNAEGEQHWLDILESMGKLKPIQSLWLGQVFCLSQDELADRAWLDWYVWFGATQQSGTRESTKNEALIRALNDQYAAPDDLVTAKEFQVLLLIGEGLNNDEIAASMHIAVSTVKSHIRRLYRKLNINHRSQAIQICKYL
ncbi:HTH-type transcriptional regulator MalT [Reinekea marina]|uniref:HTH-type transcriptional regulator MalT n=1 Tax=Reinekea marina TaxID=1310421 RepID=A0ABV7WPN2_9GAMM|nr:HTH-type transcriptional regulator MalT [Reinekea marina]MDN3647906.1 HTH-type transcriptional regulator MalT [Reinekea marina]